MTAALVRPAKPADNEALLTLARRCAMSADISLIVERDPDFFALGRARGDAHTFVAEINGEIVGCYSSWRRVGRLSGDPAEICFVGDLRVAPEQRRRGIGRQLALATHARLDALAAAPCLAAIAVGNSGATRLAAEFGAVGSPIAQFSSWQLLPLMPLKISPGLDIGSAESREAQELAALLDEFYRERDFAPVFGEGGLETLLTRSPGMALSDYLIARRRGRLVAAVGIWDAGAVKHTRVVGMPGWLTGLCTVGRGMARLLPMPPFPQRGEVLRFRYIRHVAYRSGEIQALRGLVRTALNAARARLEHFLLFTCADGDPLRSAVEGLPRLTFRYQIVSNNHPAQGRTGDSQSMPRICYFDDAALT